MKTTKPTVAEKAATFDALKEYNVFDLTPLYMTEEQVRLTIQEWEEYDDEDEDGDE